MDAGTPNAWIAYGHRPALGYGFAPPGILAKLPPGEARDPDYDFRDFAEWAAPRAITLVRSHPPSEIVGPRWVDLFERDGSDSTRVDLRRFNPEYFERLREACTMMRSLGIFVHLTFWDPVAWEGDWKRCYYHPANRGDAPLAARAGPGEFIVDPDCAPELVAHQREHVRRVLEATGDLGNVFYGIADGLGRGFGECRAWVEAMLDEVEAYERASGYDVLVGLDDGGAETGRAHGNPRLDFAFVDGALPGLHTEIRGRHGKPTFAAHSTDLSGETGFALRPERDLTVRGLRTFWRMLTVRCQMACLPAAPGRRAYRGGPLNAIAAADLPGSEMGYFDATFSRADASPDRVAESPAHRGGALVFPRRKYFVPHRQPKQAFVFLEPEPGEAGVEFPAGTLRLRGVSFLAEQSPFRVMARIRNLATGEETASTHEFEKDDLVMELPAFRDGLVVTVRQSFTPELVQDLGDPSARSPVTATVSGQSVTLEWERNVAASAWTEPLAWIQRFPGGDWIGRTPGLTFVDQDAPPGRYVYMIAWRDAASVHGAPSSDMGTAGAAPGTGLRNPEVAQAVVPDVAPAAPEIVPVSMHRDSASLWAKGEPAVDLTRWEWEWRGDDGAWLPLDTTGAFFLETPLSADVREVRARVIDAAGQAGEFSEPVRIFQGAVE